MKSLLQYMLLACAVVLAGFGSAVAQKVSISKETRLTNKISKFRVAGKMNGHFVIDRFGTYEHILDIYNSKLKLLRSKDLELTKEEWVEKMWIQQDKAFILISKGYKTYSVISARKMDARFNIAEKEIILDTLYEKRDPLISNYRTELSLNETHLMTYLPVFESGALSYFRVNVYDAQMNLVQKQKVQEEGIADYSFADIELFNDGSFILILAERKDNKDLYQTFHLYYSDANGQLTKSIYSANEGIFREPKFELDNANKQLIISGFYMAPKLKKNEKNAAYKFFVDAVNVSNGAVNQSWETEFSDDFIFDLTGKEALTGFNKLFTFSVKSIVPKMEGGMIVIAESYYKEEVNNAEMNSGFSVPGITSYVSNQVYHFNDLLVFDMAVSSNDVDVAIVRKRQVSENDNGAFSSFSVMNEQDKLKLLFLDEIFEKANLSEYTYEEGTMNNPTSILNLGEKAVFPVVKLALQSEVNEIVVPSFSRNNVSLIKIVYPQ